MKSLVLAAVLAATIPTFGQGTIVFNTQITGQKITTWQGRLLAGEAYLAQLYGATSAEGILEPIGKAYNFRSGVNAGYINVPAAEQTVTVPSVSNGGPTYLQIRAWDSHYATYDAARAAGASGSSKLWTQETGGLATPTSPPEPPPLISGFEAFSVGIPEPSVMALMGVGAAVLLFGRRKWLG